MIPHVVRRRLSARRHGVRPAEQRRAGRRRARRPTPRGGTERLTHASVLPRASRPAAIVGRSRAVNGGLTRAIMEGTERVLSTSEALAEWRERPSGAPPSHAGVESRLRLRRPPRRKRPRRPGHLCRRDGCRPRCTSGAGGRHARRGFGYQDRRSRAPSCPRSLGRTWPRPRPTSRWPMLPKSMPTERYRSAVDRARQGQDGTLADRPPNVRPAVAQTHEPGASPLRRRRGGHPEVQERRHERHQDDDGDDDRDAERGVVSHPDSLAGTLGLALASSVASVSSVTRVAAARQRTR